VPTPATGSFLGSELTSVPASSVKAGSNWIHLASIDAMANVGTVEGNFLVQVNSTPPTIMSSSHPSQTTWVNNSNVYFSWTFPVADANLKGAYYVFDQYGNTIPTANDTFVPVGQKQLLLNNVPNGVWALHLLSTDQRGYLTKAAALYKVRVGTDPGNGTLTGLVVNNNGMPVQGASVTLNHGLFPPDQVTNASGSYNFGATIPAGTWQLDVSANGLKPATQMVTIAAGQTTTANVTLTP
jgi:hypothetical protein